MAWYTSEENRTNRVTLPRSLKEQIVSGLDPVADHLATSIAQDILHHKRPCAVAIDGFKGANFLAFTTRVSALLRARGIEVTLLPIDEAFQPREVLARMVESSECPENPSFGRVIEGTMGDLIDDQALSRLTAGWENLSKNPGESGVHRAVLCFGMGAMLAEKRLSFDRVVYLDLTREQLLIRSERGEVTMLGGGAQEGFPWKRIYYVEYPLLNRHKKEVLARLDWYIDNSSLEEAVLLPAETYHTMIKTLSEQPMTLKVFWFFGKMCG